MVEQHRYDGHEIALDLIEVAPGRVRWVWCIDRVHRAKARHTATSAAVARSEALLYAQVMIGRLSGVVAAAMSEMADPAGSAR